MDGERKIRPVLWLVGSVLGILTGIGMAAGSLATATSIGHAGDAPACRSDFADGCVTERTAVLDSEGYTRGSWLTQEQKWFPDGAPNLVPGERLALRIPRQDGQQELGRNLEVTILYLGRAPAWLRLPSGSVLETEDHPRRAVLTWGWFAIFTLAGGVFGVRTAVRSARRGAWRRRTPIHPVFGVFSALATAGMFGGLAQVVAGGTAWPGLLAGALGLALGILLARRAKRRAAAGAVPDLAA